jgi:hypothetical protein
LFKVTDGFVMRVNVTGSAQSDHSPSAFFTRTDHHSTAPTEIPANAPVDVSYSGSSVAIVPVSKSGPVNPAASVHPTPVSLIWT